MKDGWMMMNLLYDDGMIYDLIFVFLHDWELLQKLVSTKVILSTNCMPGESSNPQIDRSLNLFKGLSSLAHSMFLSGARNLCFPFCSCLCGTVLLELPTTFRQRGDVLRGKTWHGFQVFYWCWGWGVTISGHRDGVQRKLQSKIWDLYTEHRV